jgi:hypothetical protein
MMTNITSETRILFAMFSIVGSLVSCSQEKQIRTDTVAYEDQNPNRIDDSTSIVFDLNDHMMRFYSRHLVDYKVKQYTEFATEFSIKTDGDVYFDESTQILIPKTMPRVLWRGFGQICSTQANNARVECISEADRNKKHVFTYDEGIGVTEFSYPCPSFSKNECNYKLISKEGIFSRAMRKRIR